MILFSLFNTGLAMMNASAFLLLAVTPSLSNYILCSTIHSAASWVYLWLVPAAAQYSFERIAAVRVAQTMIFGLATLALAVFSPTLMGLMFFVILLMEFLASPSFLIVFQSRTARYLKMDFVRNVATSCFLLVNIVKFGGVPELHALTGAIVNVAVAAFLWTTGWLPFVPVRAVPRGEVGRLAIQAVRSGQARALVAARMLEVTVVVLLNSLGTIGTLLSFRLGMAVSGGISLLARHYATTMLVTLQLAAFGAASALVVVAADTGLARVAPAIAQIGPWSFLWTAPWVVGCTILQAIGLRDRPGVVPGVQPTAGESAAARERWRQSSRTEA
ncbi:MAG: hypothetical protein NZM40_08775 [Sphingomonadaceae bacterium]|uniref:hypothetical protein n=1 Tax=Thermaurantiacus sp. TaxID=2820283 RepID=UPI00298EFD00|nr:hypothetical protein [Thermaurantiacus sp.]MCS6987502.1 hypothetical protein [Sphingomonadaceae bacterium]MDW8415103.1 hypothetical protein [Thermaurantiacus sp.]